MKSKKMVCVFASISMLSACATSPDKIQATYVSPLEYSNFDCDQLRLELIRVGGKVNEIAGVQKSESSKDAVAMGVGLVVFWPALFLLMGDDKKQELALLKGRYDAVEGAAIQQKCEYSEELRRVRLDREEAARIKKEEEEAKRRSRCNEPFC